MTRGPAKQKNEGEDRVIMSRLTFSQKSGPRLKLRRSLKKCRLKLVPSPLVESKAQTMSRVTRAVVLRRGNLSEEDFEALRKGGLTESEIVEIAGSIAANIFSNRFGSVAKRKMKFGVLRPCAGAPRGGIAQSKTRPATLRARPQKPPVSKKVLL